MRSRPRPVAPAAIVAVLLSPAPLVQAAWQADPTEAWVAQQLREATSYGQHPKHLIRDNDSKFGPAFARVALAGSIEEARRLPGTEHECDHRALPG